MVLRLARNRLTELPDGLRLPCLETLDVSGNRLRALPPSVLELYSLRRLFANENELVALLYQLFFLGTGGRAPKRHVFRSVIP